MRHFVYAMKGDDPAPAGDGDTRSWFYYYKLKVEDETYVPKGPPHLPIQGGDYLWLSMDGQILGCVPVLRVETPSLPHLRQEIWYDPKAFQELNFPHLKHYDRFEELSEQHGAAWLKSVGKKT